MREGTDYSMILEYVPEEEVFFVKFPDLPGCLAHGVSEIEAIMAGYRARNSWLETAKEAGWKIPEPKSYLS